MYRLPAALLAGCLLGQSIVRTVSPADSLTLEQKEVLSHMRFVLEHDADGRALPTIRIEGVNVQLVNGKGRTYEVNGLGNLIVGYQAADGPIDRSGSHNVIVGDDNDYSSYGGLATGAGNKLLGPACATVGSYGCTARGLHNVVLGGTENEVDGIFNAIVGGDSNTITGSNGQGNVIVGGSSDAIEGESRHNIVAGGHSHVVSGGEHNVVVGGAWNEIVDSYFVGTLASHRAHSFFVELGAMVGGTDNTMDASARSVLSPVLVGGQDNAVNGGKHVTVLGGQANSASGDWSAVTGGHLRSASGSHDWVAGTLFQDD